MAFGENDRFARGVEVMDRLGSGFDNSLDRFVNMTNYLFDRFINGIDSSLDRFVNGIDSSFDRFVNITNHSQNRFVISSNHSSHRHPIIPSLTPSPSRIPFSASTATLRQQTLHADLCVTGTSLSPSLPRLPPHPAPRPPRRPRAPRRHLRSHVPPTEGRRPPRMQKNWRFLPHVRRRHQRRRRAQTGALRWESGPAVILRSLHSQQRRAGGKTRRRGGKNRREFRNGGRNLAGDEGAEIGGISVR